LGEYPRQLQLRQIKGFLIGNYLRHLQIFFVNQLSIELPAFLAGPTAPRKSRNISRESFTTEVSLEPTIFLLAGSIKKIMMQLSKLLIIFQHESFRADHPGSFSD
jgi:hypothetical protein